MGAADVLPRLPVVCLGRSAAVLGDITRPGVELAAWQRGPDPAWAAWFESLPLDAWPTCRLELEPEEAATAIAEEIDTGIDAHGTPGGTARKALASDVAGLVTLFAGLTRAPRVRLRLDRVTDDACRRWHRDCVPLRLICTYRGPGTQWVPPAWGAAVLAEPDAEVSQAMAFDTGDVALFKGCGWKGAGQVGQTHDGGIVHRSPRIAGTGITRLLLVLDVPAGHERLLAA